MSTRSMIFKENQDGSFTGIYCHFDGYPGYVGRCLKRFYASEEMIDKLIALGDISSLDESPDDPPADHSFSSPAKGYVVAYHRDRGEPFEDVAPMREPSIFHVFNSVKGIDYLYFWSKDKGWKCLNYNKKECLIP